MNRNSSFKFGPYDYYQGNDPSMKLPPLFIHSVIFLESNGLEEEGLMHLRGNEPSMKHLRLLLNDGPLAMSSLSDVHTVATVLREFFIDAPVSLVPEEKYSDFISAADSRQNTLDSLRDLLTSIPLSHQRVLHRLLIFFRAVLKQYKKNRVKLETIAAQYGPVLLRRPTNITLTPVEADTHSDCMFKLMCKLLDNHLTLFEGIGLNHTGAEPIAWARIYHELSNKRTLKYTIPVEQYNPTIKEVEENAERVKNRLNDVATRMSENYERAKEKRRKVLNEAKEKAVREWHFTKRNFDQEKANYEVLHQIWQAACERVAATTRELDNTRNEYDDLKRYYGVMEEPNPATPPSSSPVPSPRLRLATPPFSNLGISGNSNSPNTPQRERGSTDPIRPTLSSYSSPPPRPVSVSFGSPVRPKMIRRSSDPPPKFRNAVPTLLPITEKDQQPQIQQEPEPDPLPQQQQRKLQVHQQLLQTLQIQIQPKAAAPTTPIPLLHPPPASYPKNGASIRFPVLQQPETQQISAPQSSQPSPQSPPIARRNPKSLPPIPIPPPPAVQQMPLPEESPRKRQALQQSQQQLQQTQQPQQPQAQSQSIQAIQNQERRQSLPRSYSDDQTKKKASDSPSAVSTPSPLFHSLPDLPSLTDLLQLRPQRSSTMDLMASQTYEKILNSSLTDKVLTSSVSDNYASLRPDEVAHLEEVQAKIEFLEAEVEVCKFEVIVAEKEKKKAEAPFDIAQVEHWKSVQGIRRLDVSDSEAESWQI